MIPYITLYYQDNPDICNKISQIRLYFALCDNLAITFLLFIAFVPPHTGPDRDKENMDTLEPGV